MARWPAQVRIPFPVKVFVALVGVAAAGAIPTYAYIEASFTDQLIGARVDETTQRASVLAEMLRPLGRAERMDRVTTLSHSQLERITYLGPTGVVLYDSAGQASGVLDFPEVAVARGGEATQETIAVPASGVGAAKRRDRDGDLTIYVAVPIDEGGEILRLGFEASDVDSLVDRLRAVFRNSLALAVSFAILLAVLAAFTFMRPLQRLARSAQRIADGDYTASEHWRGSDEIGDVGLALNRMAMELRQRLATAQASETLLMQAAEFLYTPLAVVTREGRVLLINGAFRHALESESDAEEMVARLLGSKKYLRMFDAIAEGRSDGVMRWTKKKIGVVLQMHLLERPQTSPLVLLTLHDDHGRGATLPGPADVSVVRLGGLVDGALARVAALAPTCTFEVDWVDASPDDEVVEVEGRVELALAVYLESAARGAERMKLCAALHGVTAEVWIDGDVPAAPTRLVRQLLAPCGGHVQHGEYVSLHLPRA